jgi:SAM-dependent methyltransferase
VAAMNRHPEWANWNVTSNRPEANLAREMDLTTQRLVVLGCGPYLPPGAIGVDCNPDSEASIVCDLNTDRLPLLDHSVDVVASNHTVEHLPGVRHVVCECWRILKPGGRIVWRMPYAQTQMMLVQGHVPINGAEDWWTHSLSLHQHFDGIEFEFEYDPDLLAVVRGAYGAAAPLAALRRLHWNLCMNVTLSAVARPEPLATEDVCEMLYGYRGVPYSET